MPVEHIEAKNIVFHKRQVGDGWYPHENINSRRTKSMSRTIEAIMRHMALPPSRVTDQSNRVEKLEKEITVQKRHYVWSESRFVRTMLPFHSNVRVGYNGTEVDGKSVLDLMTLTPPEGTKVRIRIEGPDAAEAMHAVDQLVQWRSDDD
jgi:phosphotransferase system HPr (HPr) family protein